MSKLIGLTAAIVIAASTLFSGSAAAAGNAAFSITSGGSYAVGSTINVAIT